MKILHTSDWHLGHLLYNYDRTEEHQSMLQQIINIVRQHQPDVFLLCGDVYHTPQPSASVQTLFANTLVDIHEACPAMSIIITAGNHDSGSKHEIFRTPWKALNVHAVGQLYRDNTDHHIIHIPGKGYIVAIPYIHERNMPEGFFQQMLDKVAAQNTNSLPVVMTAHTTVSGCDYTGHNHANEFSIGGIDPFDINQMGTGYDYLALGHIHHEQFVHSGNHNVRYSGSPIAVSFDESYPHSISLVEISAHGQPPIVSKLEIDNPRPLVTLPISGFATWDEAKDLLRNYPSDIPAYIRLNVLIEDFLPVEANAEVAVLIDGKQCRFCYINTHRPAELHSHNSGLTVQEFQSEKPIDIARRYADDLGITFDPEMVALFNEVMDKLSIDSREEQ